MAAKRRVVTNPLALAVLAELMPGPTHPYELGRRLKEHGKDRYIKYNRSSLYTVVEQLHRAGFITEQETVRDTQRPERTIYRITDAGRAELYDWLRELVAEPREEYPHFGVALSLLMVLPPQEAVDLLGQRLATLDGLAVESRDVLDNATEDGVAWIYLIEEDYALQRTDVERRFVTKLIESLKDPEYLRAWHELAEKMT